MKRKLTERLIPWKVSARRKPLLLYGARQVGKTYLIKEFGSRHFEDMAYFNLEFSERTAAVFKGDLDPERIVTLLAGQRGKAIEPGKTLIVLDEIQKEPRAITSLKYFQELAPHYQVIAAGSLLGVTLRRSDNSFPVGKVDTLTLYPMDFEEFLWALGQKQLADLINEAYQSLRKFELHETALELYRLYLAVGGMPESVAVYTETHELADCVEILREIDRDYLADMAKYATPYEGGRAIEAWESLPSQLTKTNHKFQYNRVRSGGRASQYEVPIAWLTTANIAIRCTLAEVALDPLMLSSDPDSFKLYLSDTGLLCSKLGADPHAVVEGTVESAGFRGILAENFVVQHLVSQGLQPFYWKSRGKAEVEFVFRDNAGAVVPLEVKSGSNVQSQSLNVYREKFCPAYALRLSTKNFGFANGIKSIPLYAAFCLE
jgi:predicted AAA+ superfamily ATPase